MNRPKNPYPWNLNRRQFLGACATCAAYAYATAAAPGATKLVGFEVPADGGRARVRLVFCHEPADRPTWPNIGYDYVGRIKELAARLEKACPNIRFLPVTLQKAEDAEKLLLTDKDIDGYLVYLVGIWTGVSRAIAFSGRPTILADDLYAGSGEFLIENAAARRQGLKVVGVASSRFQDVVDALKSFECMKRMRVSRIIDVTDAESLGDTPKTIKGVFGTDIRQVTSAEFNSLYDKADRVQASKWADTWIKGAAKVIEPTREEIVKAGAMYLAELDLLNNYKAQAITMSCLGLIYAGKVTAYPCLGFFQLNNDGLVGACEADLPSTVTMLMMNYLTGKPGYISDPVIDTAKNQIIYAHCLAPNKMFGPEGPSNPYHIRSHSENRKGAVVRSLMPLQEMTTTLDWNPARNEIVMHQGVTVENVDEDKACRNKLAAEVKGDINKLLGEWDRFGWHRVTFYGDHKKAVETTATLLGIKVTPEA